MSSALKTLLTTDSSKYTWSAAVSGAQNAASYELATGTSVIAIGGFNGTTNGPTLAQFETWVAEGKIHYYIASGTGGGFGGGGSSSGSSSSIEQWVSEHYTATTVGSTTVYDLTQATSTSGSTGSTSTTGDNA